MAQPVSIQRAAQAGPPAASLEDFVRQVTQALESERTSIERLLGKAIDTDRFLQAAIEEVKDKAPRLYGSSVLSVVQAVKDAALMALIPSSRLGYCYLWPSYNSNNRTKEVQCMLGYRGGLQLAYRSGMVQYVTGRVVHEKDTFQIVFGTQGKLEHIPSQEADPGKPIGAYILVQFASGAVAFHYLTTAQIERHRARSKAATSGPWESDWEAMAIKTVVRDAMRWLPTSLDSRGRVARLMVPAEAVESVSWDDMAPDADEVEPED